MAIITPTTIMLIRRHQLVITRCQTTRPQRPVSLSVVKWKGSEKRWNKFSNYDWYCVIPVDSLAMFFNSNLIVLQCIEQRLKVTLPEDLGSALMDGVVLCHLANHVRPRSVASIHVPSPAVPKLPVARCRRNVENFIQACRMIGVPEVSHSFLKTSFIFLQNLSNRSFFNTTGSRSSKF